jgi:rod shape-determining protein MreC
MPGLFEGFVGRHRRGVTLAILLGISLLCLLVSNRAVIIRPKEIGLSVAGFFQKGVTGFFGWFGDTAGSIRQLRLARGELETARARLADADRTAREAVELRRENAMLRELLGLAQALPLPRIAAGVVAKDHDNLFSTITLNKGARHGIRVDMPVVAFQDDLEGLVGRVVAVGSGTSQVLPLYDPACKVSARLEESRFEGLAGGQGADRTTLLMRYVKKIAADRIEYGDLVISAGLGGLYPAGINIGRVRDIRAETYETSLTLEIEPVIDFDRLEYVFALGGPVGGPATERAATPPPASGAP